MKNKGILIAIAIVVVAALVGVFIFLYLKDPEILTRSPSEIISGNVGEGNEEEVVIPGNSKPPSTVSDFLDPQGDCLVVSSSNCKFASFVRDPEGNPSNAGIVFSGFPEGMKLYAPMSGYVTLFNGSKSSPHFVVYISESADPVVEWGTFGPKTGRFIIFRAEEIELLEVGVKDGALYVEKGEPFAEVTKKSELFPGEYKEKPELFVLFDKNWADTLVVSVDSPREYMKKVFENLN
jgi:hypothetical protein